MRQRVMTLIGTVFVGYGVLIAIMFLAQRSFLYFPSGHVPPLAEGMELVETRTSDGLTLRHWYRPPSKPGNPVVVIFHGNAGNMADRLPKYGGLAQLGVGVFLAEYRGYGGNPGAPTQSGLLADGRSVMGWLAGRGVLPASVVLYGESLGTGVAVDLARDHLVAGVVLEAPYSSVAEVAQHHYWYLPAKWLILDKWNSTEIVDQITAPLLVLHGEQDKVIPVQFGQRLFEAAKGWKELHLQPQAGHNDLYAFPQVSGRIETFLRRVHAGARP